MKTHADDVLEARAEDLREQLFSVVHRLKSVDARCAGSMDTDISLPELRVIEILGDCPGLMMKELADRMLAAVSTATGLVDKLVQKGYVRRDRGDEDRRIVRVDLSDSGRVVCEGVKAMHLDLCRGMLAALNEDEREIFLVLMRKIARGPSPIGPGEEREGHGNDRRDRA